MAEANLSLQLLPIASEDQIYSLVDEVIALIHSTGLSYVVGPMETTVEGDLNTLLNIVKESQYICTRAGVKRVISVIKLDYKPDGVTIDEKIAKYR